MNPVILVHGGAGAWELTTKRFAQAKDVCQIAAKAGYDVLLAAGSSLDAVEAAVRILEDSPILDAGRGSYLNAAGDIEMDALIMDGATLELGAVAAVNGILNPISLARCVMEKSEHSFLVSNGAETFAQDMDFQPVDLDDLMTPSQKETCRSIKESHSSESANQVNASSLAKSVTGDTVGAVAIDSAGNLAAATSTGGTKGKHPGRVGDSPLVGSGAYADNWTAAVSATGHGESLMRVVISKRVCDLISLGLSSQKACEAAIDILNERVKGQGGVIGIDLRGQIGIAYNTVAMPHAYSSQVSGIVVGN